MQTTQQRVSQSASQRAFTLIELMVVVAIIGILIGGVFQLLSTAGKMNQKAETTSRLQRLQNALSGFYAEYGTYPPVPQYCSPDPWASGLQDDFGNSVSDVGTEGGFSRACSLAAASQPVSFEYPNEQGLDSFVNQTYKQWGILSANSVLGPTAASTSKDDWGNLKAFKFGLLSYLLPRLEQIGFAGLNGSSTSPFEPNFNFYMGRQWKANNPGTSLANNDESEYRKALVSQQILENRAASHWMPNLEKIIFAGHIVLGVNTTEPGSDGNNGVYRTYDVRDSKGNVIDMKGYDQGGNQYALRYVSVRDGWGRDLFYYSAPPYQSYRIWSAGADAKTFPPWIPIGTLTGNERKWAAEWTKDDIVRFDH